MLTLVYAGAMNLIVVDVSRRLTFACAEISGHHLTTLRRCDLVGTYLAMWRSRQEPRQLKIVRGHAEDFCGKLLDANEMLIS